MRLVTRYEATDGSVWLSEGDALERDDLIEVCRNVERTASMKDRPSKTEYTSGRGYVQQPKGTREYLLSALRVMGANRDSDGPIGRLMYRMHCMDDDDREWGQPYYAMHPDQAENQEIVEEER
jgi:hypothetical protein